MPIPGFSLITPPEFITAAEAVKMVIERFKSSACTETDARAWLSKQVHQRKLKLSWADIDPEHFGGLQLAGEGMISLRFFRLGARTIDEVDWDTGLAIDELDWKAGELRRQVRYRKRVDRKAGESDRVELTADELRARYGYRGFNARDEPEGPVLGARSRYGYRASDPDDKPEDWITEELTCRFRVRHSALSALLDRAAMPLGALPVPLSEAAGIVANHFSVSPRMGLAAIVEAAGAERIEVYGKPPSNLLLQGERVSPWVWRDVARGEAALSADATLLSGKPLYRHEPATCSDLHVFRADLERLIRELAGDSGTMETASAPAEPVAGGGQQPRMPELARPEAAIGSSGAGDDGAMRPRFRGDKGRVWEAAKRHGRPDFTKRGALAVYVSTLARETGVKEATVRNYVSKPTELRPCIENLPEPSPPQRG